MKPGKKGAERRSLSRSRTENAVTPLVQLLIRNPADGAAVVERDLAAGADPQIVAGLLDAVEACLTIRGVDRHTHLAAMRRRIERA